MLSVPGVIVYWLPGEAVAEGVDVGVGVRVAVGLGEAVAVAVGVGVGPNGGGTCASVKASPAALMRLSNHMPSTLPVPLPLTPSPRQSPMKVEGWVCTSATTS